MWYELIPAPGSDDDQQTFLKRARRAGEALELASRPTVSSWRDMLNHDDGIVLLAHADRRWICLPDGADPMAATLMARACDATAVRTGRPAVLDRRLSWAHAIVPRGATLARSARDELEDGADARLDPGDDGLVYANVRRQGFMEVKRCKDWLGDEFNMSPDTSKLQEPAVGVARVGAAYPTGREAMRMSVQAANALDLGLTPGLGAHRSHPGWGLPLIAFGLNVILTLVSSYTGWWPVILPGMLMIVGALIRLRRMPVDRALWQRARHWWWPFARRRPAASSDLKTRSSGDDQNVDTKHSVHAYAYHRASLPIPSGTLATLCRPPVRSSASRVALTRRPDALGKADGPLLGVDMDDAPTRMPANVTWGWDRVAGRTGQGQEQQHARVDPLGGRACRGRGCDDRVRSEGA